MRVVLVIQPCRGGQRLSSWGKGCTVPKGDRGFWSDLPFVYMEVKNMLYRKVWIGYVKSGTTESTYYIFMQYTARQDIIMMR